jgi:integrase
MRKFRISTRFSLISSGKNSDEKQIHLVCTIAGCEIFYYSGYRVPPKNFIRETVSIGSSTVRIQQVRKNTFNKAGDPAGRINMRLRELENAVQRVFERSYNGRSPEDFSKESFKTSLKIELGELDTVKESPPKSFFEAYEEYRSAANVSEGRRGNIKTDIKRLRTYAATLKYELSESTLDLLDYKKYIRKTLSENTVVSVMKRLKDFFSEARRKKVFKTSPFDDINFAKDIGAEIYDEPVCMTRDELSALYRIVSEEEKVMLAKDMFCLQAALGCRVGDLVRLAKHNVQDGKLTYYPHKKENTSVKVEVPLSGRAKEIIAKYEGVEKSDRLMPFMRTNEYNVHIKEAFRIANLDRTVIRFNRELKKEEHFKLYELASTHMARRTFVDILCQAGEPLHVVASMSGHSERSKAFDRYRSRPARLQLAAVIRSMD